VQSTHPISDESVHHFVRGEASEFLITDLANMGVAQAELEMDPVITAFPYLSVSLRGKYHIIKSSKFVSC